MPRRPKWWKDLWTPLWKSRNRDDHHGPTACASLAELLQTKYPAHCQHRAALERSMETAKIENMNTLPAGVAGGKKLRLLKMNAPHR